MQPVPRVQPLPRVHKVPHNPYQRMEHSLAGSNPTHVRKVQPRTPTTTPHAHTQVRELTTTLIRPHQRRTTPHIAYTPPSCNTRSKVTTPSVGPISRNTRSQSDNSAKQLQQITEQMSTLEDEVH